MARPLRSPPRSPRLGLAGRCWVEQGAAEQVFVGREGLLRPREAEQRVQQVQHRQRIGELLSCT